MNKKGFTLIELLAVIVILALVSVIATPIVLNIINSTKIQALKRSSELYIDAVNNAIARRGLTESKEISNGKYSINSDGNIELGDEMLKVDVSGDKPKKGWILYKNKKLYVISLCYDDNKYIIKDENGTILFSDKEYALDLPVLMKEPIFNPTATSAFLGNTLGVTRGQIKSIKFETTSEVPSNTIGSWDVSANKDKTVMAWYTSIVIDDVTYYEVHIGGENGVKANQDSSSLFQNLTELTSIGVKKLDTSDVIYMSNMFSGSKKITTLDVSLWKTDKVVTVYSMFMNCQSLTSLDLSSWNITSKVKSIENMFQNCSSLTSLVIGSWDVSGVSSMANMFMNCYKLAELNISSLKNVNNVTNLSDMFMNCQSLTSLDLNNWSTSSVTNMLQMFMNCKALTELNISSWNVSSVTNMSNMFQNCSSLTSLDISSWNVSSVKTMNSMFQNCNQLTKLDLSSWETKGATNMEKMFAYNTSLESLKIPNFVIKDSSVNLNYFLDSCSILTSINLSNATIADMGVLKPSFMLRRETSYPNLIITVKDEQSRSWLESNCTVNCTVNKV